MIWDWKVGDSEPSVGAELVFFQKKTQILQIYDHFDIASLNWYTPKLARVPQKLTWCQQFGLQVLQKRRDAKIFLSLKKGRFRCFSFTFAGKLH